MMREIDNMGVKNRWIGWLLLAAGTICIAVGAVNGQYADVFRKAIFICLECVGIG